MLKFQKLLSRLKEIHVYIVRCRVSGRVEPGMPDKFSLEKGICGNLNGAFVGTGNWIKEAFERWPKFSGIIKYPVPDEGEESNPQYIFNCSYPNKWIGNTYADNRFELLEFLIAELEHKLKKSETTHPHAKLMALYDQDAARTANPEKLWQYKGELGDWRSLDELNPPRWFRHSSYRRHPHADLMLEWEKDQYENPEQVWQARHQEGPWQRLPHHSPQWSDEWEYRRKPKVRRIGAYEYPEPESKSLRNGQTYWIPSLVLEEGAFAFTWRGDTVERRWLAQELVHLTKEAAAAHAEAMLKGWTE